MENNRTIGGRVFVNIELSSLAIPFVVAIAIGCIFIFIGVFFNFKIISILMPSICMVGYIYYALTTENNIPVSVAGDSFYYLGFILTLISLLVSLISLSIIENININNVIGSFGAALSTTILGLISRLIITTFSVQEHERRERIEEDIDRTIKQFIAQLNLLTNDTISSLVIMNSKTEEALTKTLNQYVLIQDDLSNKYIESMSNNLNVIDVSVNELTEKINNIKVSPEIISKPLNKSLNEIIYIMNSTQPSYKKVFNELSESNGLVLNQIKNSEGLIQSHINFMEDKFNEQIIKSAEDYKKALNVITQEINQLSTVKVELEKIINTKFDDFIENITKSTKGVNIIANSITDSSMSISNAKDTLEDSMLSLVTTSQKINNSLNINLSSIDKVLLLKTELSELTKSIPILRKQIMEMSTEAIDATKAIKEISQTVDNTTKQLSNDISTVYSRLADQIQNIESV